MRKLAVAALVLGLAGVTGTVEAQDKKNDPTGTWKWTIKRNDKEFEQTVKLKLEGDKLTGVMPGRKEGTETKIEDGKFKDGEVTFTVTRERGGMKIVSKYKGKVDGDKIKGTIETDRDGQTQKADWEAKRVKDKDN
jgi:hypothetical protein